MREIGRDSGTAESESKSKMTKNVKDKRYEKDGVTPSKIIAFFESKAGKSQAEIGTELGVSQKTISRWTGEIEEFIKQSPQYQQAAPKIAEMIPRALMVYANKLELDDLTAARDVLKMATIFVERRQVDQKSDLNISTDDLWDELRGLVGSESDPKPDESGSNESEPDSQGDKASEDSGTA